MEQLQSLLFQMIVYKINYLKWCCENNLHECQNWCIWKVEMEIVGLDFHLLHMLNQFSFSTRKQINGNIMDHNKKIEMLFHIIQLCYYYGVLIWIFYVSHFFIGHFIY
jgi:hypothetical protein